MGTLGSILDYVNPTALGNDADLRPESMQDPERYEEVMIIVAGTLDEVGERRLPGGPKLLDGEDLVRYKTLIDAEVEELDDREWTFALCVYGTLFPEVVAHGSKPDPNEMVLGTEDPDPRKGSPINSPPSDGRCMCCGRHLIELTPFGRAGDPLVGDFNGAVLIQKYRRVGPYDEEAVEALKQADECFEIDGYADALKWMVAKYGKEEGERLYRAAELCLQFGKSWECRDCAILDEDEYFERLRIRFLDEQKQEFDAQQTEESGPQ